MATWPFLETTGEKNAKCPRDREQERGRKEENERKHEYKAEEYSRNADL